MKHPDYECEDCIGMKEHGCYCMSVGAVAPGGPLADDIMVEPPRWTYLPWGKKTCGERGLTASALVGSILGCASLLIFTVLTFSLFAGAK